ncbi:LysE family transporter [Priestia endophytica]|uniref:Threonine/homoserine/homoserine lactone efflux protein n=1 Tax=Priestia endophytica DSM 13796 TaxID=1121089 RepID=A0A1I6B5P0_9BACI|nr:LysE family transporter [Priestia endophytica]KYG26775.1 lysine transporter LysE [Priestia endophytica]SFQ76117.1 Threonine/homoserine/homoserine lactone efflux protein [Priestia endophytica DSM 13796]
MNFTAFLSYIIITSITPGPSNLLMMNEARRFGFKKSLPFNIGILSGFIILGIVTSLLTTSLYKWIPMIEPYFKVVGAVYLLYLAWKIAFSKGGKEEDIDNQSSFFSGLFFQILNVKSILYFLTALSTFVLPYSGSNITIFFFMCLTIVIGCVALLLWAVFGAAFKKLFSKYNKTINIVMCLLLVYSAITIF